MNLCAKRKDVSWADLELVIVSYLALDQISEPDPELEKPPENGGLEGLRGQSDHGKGGPESIASSGIVLGLEARAMTGGHAAHHQSQISGKQVVKHKPAAI